MSQSSPKALFDSYLERAAKIGQSFPIPGLSIDESIHEARLALWQAANTFDSDRGTFEGFASIVIRNHLRNCFERAKRLSVGIGAPNSLVGSEKEEAGDNETALTQEADPRLEAERADIRKAIKQSLDALTVSQKEILERFASGQSYAEIGREKGVSTAAIRQMAVRALERVRPNLEAQSIDVRFMPMRKMDEERPIELSFIPRGMPQRASPSRTFAGKCLALALLLGGTGILIHFIQASRNTGQ